MILTYNEQDNIDCVLEKLRWAQRVVVVDSGSTDQTPQLLSRYSNVEVVHRTFDSFARQCNFGLTHVRTPWVLSLDADYVLSDAFVEELRNLGLSDRIAGYSARFVYMVQGRPLRGTLYPRRTVLFQRSLAQYRDEGHGHRVNITGPVQRLSAPIYHDDRKPLDRWFASQRGYVKKEADFLLAAPRSNLRLPDRLRLLLWPAPFMVFFYTLLVKGCLFDGWRGWQYAMQRLVAECMLAIELLDRRLAAASSQSDRGR